MAGVPTEIWSSILRLQLANTNSTDVFFLRSVCKQWKEWADTWISARVESPSFQTEHISPKKTSRLLLIAQKVSPVRSLSCKTLPTAISRLTDLTTLYTTGLREPEWLKLQNLTNLAILKVAQSQRLQKPVALNLRNLNNLTELEVPGKAYNFVNYGHHPKLRNLIITLPDLKEEHFSLNIPSLEYLDADPGSFDPKDLSLLTNLRGLTLRNLNSNVGFMGWHLPCLDITTLQDLRLFNLFFFLAAPGFIDSIAPHVTRLTLTRSSANNYVDLRKFTNLVQLELEGSRFQDFDLLENTSLTHLTLKRQLLPIQVSSLPVLSFCELTHTRVHEDTWKAPALTRVFCHNCEFLGDCEEKFRS